MDSVDVFVIGGGGTGSEVAFSLARSSGLNVALAERDKLGGECNHYGCVPTKVMLRSAKIAALARDGARFGLRIPEVDVDFQAVQQRAPRRDRCAVRRGSGAVRARGGPGVPAGGPPPRRASRGARGRHRDRGRQGGARNRHGGRRSPPIPGLDGRARIGRTAKRSGSRTRRPASLAVIGTGAIGTEFAQIYARFGSRVTALEALPHLLPQEDEEAAASLVPALEADGIDVRPDVRIERADHDGSGVDARARGGRSRDRRRAPRRDGTAADVRAPRPGCRRRRAGRRGEARPDRHAPHLATRTSGWRATRPATSCSPTSAPTRPSSS